MSDFHGYFKDFICHNFSFPFTNKLKCIDCFKAGTG